MGAKMAKIAAKPKLNSHDKWNTSLNAYAKELVGDHDKGIQAGAIAFTTCTAYTSFLGPAAVVPGIACSVASTMAIDGTYEKVNNFINAPPPVNTRGTKRARGNDEF
jgi:hypothetical protein